MLIRVLLSIFFLLVLGGCEEQEVPTKPTVETLQKQLQEQLGTRQAEIQLAERVVTAYQVCSWIVNTCTRQVEIEGAKAETLGHTGATNVALWAGLFSRGLLALLALALLIQMSKALASWTRLAIVEPKRGGRLQTDGRCTDRSINLSMQRTQIRLIPAEHKPICMTQVESCYQSAVCAVNGQSAGLSVCGICLALIDSCRGSRRLRRGQHAPKGGRVRRAERGAGGRAAPPRTWRVQLSFCVNKPSLGLLFSHQKSSQSEALLLESSHTFH